MPIRAFEGREQEKFCRLWQQTEEKVIGGVEGVPDFNERGVFRATEVGVGVSANDAWGP
jgi:hypothetical protein